MRVRSFVRIIPEKGEMTQNSERKEGDGGLYSLMKPFWGKGGGEGTASYADEGREKEKK